MITLDAIEKNSLLSQSELYGQDYEDAVPRHVHTYNELSIKDVDDWYNSVIFHYQLNDNQLVNFGLFFNQLRNLLDQIDPAKLKIKVDWIEEESDLLLWRESHAGISKLVFEDTGRIVYSFNGNDGSKVRGGFDNTIDFVKLLLRFLSK